MALTIPKAEEIRGRVLKVPFGWVQEPVKTGLRPDLYHRATVFLTGKLRHYLTFTKASHIDQIAHLIYSHQAKGEYLGTVVKAHHRRQAFDKAWDDLYELTERDLKQAHYTAHFRADKLRVKDGQLLEAE